MGSRREVREETGIEIEIERLTGVYKNMELGVVALVFRCRHAVPAPDPESAQVTLLDGDEVVIPTRYSNDVWSNPGTERRSQGVSAAFVFSTSGSPAVLHCFRCWSVRCGVVS